MKLLLFSLLNILASSLEVLLEEPKPDGYGMKLREEEIVVLSFLISRSINLERFLDE